MIVGSRDVVTRVLYKVPVSSGKQLHQLGIVRVTVARALARLE